MPQPAFYVGTNPIAQVARQLTDYVKLVGEPSQVLAQTVLVKTEQNNWEHFSTTVHLWPPDNRIPLGDLNLDRVQLKEITFGFSELVFAGQPFFELASWWSQANRGEIPAFNEYCFVQHYNSHNQWFEEPCWLIKLIQSGNLQLGMPIPQGPFYSNEKKIFAQSVGELSAKWSSNPELLNRSNPANEYCVIVPEKRFWIRDCQLEKGKLQISVSGLARNDRHFVVRHTDHWNKKDEIMDAFPGTELSLRLERSIKTIDIYLMVGDEITDHFHEDEFQSTWGKSILQPNRALNDKVFADLTSVLESGENDHVEFKEWIKADSRDGKTKELLKTASAFSNLAGGYVYIGVNRSAEVVGIIGPLRKIYGAKTGGDLDKMIGLYLTDLKNLLNEGIERSIHPTFDPIQFAGFTVVRIYVPEGKEKPYSLVENGEIYVRAGATNRRPKPADAYLFPKTTADDWLKRLPPQ